MNCVSVHFSITEKVKYMETQFSLSRPRQGF